MAGLKGFCLVAIFAAAGTFAAAYDAAPAGIRPTLRRAGSSILPGGRIIAPLGDQFVTGPGPFGLALSPSGKSAATANSGGERNSLTILDRNREGRWGVRQILAAGDRDKAAGDKDPAAGDKDQKEEHDQEWRGVFMGVAFSGDRSILVSEGNSGRVSLIDAGSEERRKSLDLNQNGFHDSFSGDLALDRKRGLFYVVDQANFRVVVADARSLQIRSSIKTGRLPFALALSPDGNTLYITHAGMFEYRAVPGADRSHARDTGLPFPAFGFPSADAIPGVERQTSQGPVKVPGLGDPNGDESNSVGIIDVSRPEAPKLTGFVRTGSPVGEKSRGGSSPSAVLATAEQVFVANAGNDSVTILNARTHAIEGEIPIRIPGLETLRGVLPIGLAYHEATGWLLVAEAGINAIGVIDTRAKRVLGHLPAGWFPARIAIDRDTVFVANARGGGSSPSATESEIIRGPRGLGSVSIFPLPKPDELAAQTRFVMEANGFVSRQSSQKPLPEGIKHVVLIVKEGRSYDEVLGDIAKASNGPAAGAPALASFGSLGFADGKGKRLSLHDIDLTPNHHAIARQWAFSDNFYADNGGHHWLAGSYPNAWTETSLIAASSGNREFRLGAPGRLAFAGPDSSVQPEDLAESGTLWHHLTEHHISFYNFGEGLQLAGVHHSKDVESQGARYLTNMPMPEPLFQNTSRQYPGFNMNVPDQYRASQFMREIDEKYVKGGAPLPQFIYVYLPGDQMAAARPEDGYPYEESFLVDNDYALGRIVEYLSTTPWWKEMAVFITEASVEGGVDHVDAHRTLLLCAGPWAKRGYVSHVNAGFPALLKTVLRIFHMPPLNLFDASAADLADCFDVSKDPATYKARDVVKQIFDPAAVRLPGKSEPAAGQSPATGVSNRDKQ